MKLMDEILSAVTEHVTRIDIACDIETDVRPLDFVEQLSHKKMQSSGYQKSNSGETCYVGSQKSDRYARCYRYNDPHPRAHLLRIEHVFRKEYAKVTTQAIIEHGIDHIATSAGKAFGWSHPIWQTTNDLAPSISVVSSERNAGKTIFWLVNSVSPAFKRLVTDGTIVDPETFVRRYFLDSYQ
jgi:DNA relaxase NicK